MAIDAREGANCRVRLGEHFHLVVQINEKARKERLDELATDQVSGSLVEIARLGQQGQIGVYRVAASRQLFICSVETLKKVVPLHRDCPQASLEFIHGEIAVGNEFDQTIFLPFQLLELASKGLAKFDVCLIPDVDGCGEIGSQLGNYLSRETFKDVPISHCLLGLINAQVRKVALARLSSCAEEVLIRPSVAFGLCEDELACLSPLRASLAQQQAA